jgi:hypothetical protein
MEHEIFAALTDSELALLADKLWRASWEVYDAGTAGECALLGDRLDSMIRFR